MIDKSNESDMSVRKQVEESLQEEHELLEYVLSATGTGLDIIDRDFNLHFVNSGWQKVYGNPTGRKCYEYFNGLSEPCPGCGIPKALETRQVIITEEVLTRENNRLVEVRIIPFQNAKGEWLVAEINIDITKRKKAEELLRMNESKLTSILNSTRDVVWALSWPDLGIIFISPSVEVLYGRPIQDFFDRPSIWNEVVHPDDRHLAENALKELQKNGTAERECRIIRPDGSIVWIYDKSILVLDEHKKPIRVDGIASDITERKKAQDALQESKFRAEQAARSKAEFADYVAHELRTPLTSLVATVEALDDLVGNSDQREYIAIIKESADALTSVINQTLDFSRAQAGRITLECIPFNLAQVVKTRSTMHLQTASGKGVTLKVNLDPSVSRLVTGDPQRLGQVLSNLLGNAIKFTDTGEIRVEAVCEEVGNGRIIARFRVADTGPGIAPEAVPLLFERFSQESAATVRTHGGSGLGLAICKLLVEQMGGAISVESALGKGSVFSFSVALAAADSEVQHVD